MQHSVPVREFYIVALQFPENFRRENKEQNDHFQRCRQIDFKTAFNQSRNFVEKESQHTDKDIFIVLPEKSGNQRDQNKKAQYDIGDDGWFVLFQVVWNLFLFGFLFIFNSFIKSSNKVVSVGSNISHFPS